MNVVMLEKSDRGGMLAALDASGEHLGYLGFARSGKSLLIESIGTKPEHRRQGVASKMFACLCQMFPDLPVRIGYTTEDGEAWASSVRDVLADR